MFKLLEYARIIIQNFIEINQILCLGLAVIDFEHWRPIYEENFGSLSLYKDYSMEIEKYNHPLWQNNDLLNEVPIMYGKLKDLSYTIFVHQ